MFKINIKHTGSYAEEGQKNPIRWINLKRVDDKTFESTSNWWKCKDFLNDLAYTVKTGKDFSIYGWNAGTIALPKKGEPFYLAVKNLTPQFYDNMNVMNDWLVDSQKMPFIPCLKNDDGLTVIALDPVYFDNTYNISLITLVIRLMNIEHKFKNFDEVIKYKSFTPGDDWKWEAVVKKGKYFAIPEKFKKYIWYVNAEINSENPPAYNIASTVHNNGVVSWGNNW